MRNDLPGNDPKAIWQDQPTEVPRMTLEKIKQKVRESESKRRRGLFGSVVVMLEVIAVSSFGIVRAQNDGLRLLFALAIAWALAGQGFLHRGMWPQANLQTDATLDTGMVFYRRELERHRSLTRRGLQWSFGPVVLSIVALIAVLLGMGGNHLSRSMLISMMPFTTLFVVWIFAFFLLRARQHRKLLREVDALNEIERSSKPKP